MKAPVRYAFAAKTRNTSNSAQGASRGGMHARARERKQLRDKARVVAIAELRRAGVEPRAAIPCTLTLTRVAPSAGLDPHDGLRTALKPIVDGIADALGLRTDRDPRVHWEYAQRRGEPREYAVEVLVERGLPKKADLEALAKRVAELEQQFAKKVAKKLNAKFTKKRAPRAKGKR